MLGAALAVRQPPARAGLAGSSARAPRSAPPLPTWRAMSRGPAEWVRARAEVARTGAAPAGAPGADGLRAQVASLALQPRCASVSNPCVLTRWRPSVPTQPSWLGSQRAGRGPCCPRRTARALAATGDTSRPRWRPWPTCWPAWWRGRPAAGRSRQPGGDGWPPTPPLRRLAPATAGACCWRAQRAEQAGNVDGGRRCCGGAWRWSSAGGR